MDKAEEFKQLNMPSTMTNESIELCSDIAPDDCEKEVKLPTIKIQDIKNFYHRSVKLGEITRFNLIFMVCSKPFETTSCGKMSVWVEDIQSKGKE